jgi:hypothetical protein
MWLPITQYILSYTPYPLAVTSIRNPMTRHTVVTWDPKRMEWAGQEMHTDLEGGAVSAKLEYQETDGRIIKKMNRKEKGYIEGTREQHAVDCEVHLALGLATMNFRALLLQYPSH